MECSTNLPHTFILLRFEFIFINFSNFFNLTTFRTGEIVDPYVNQSVNIFETVLNNVPLKESDLVVNNMWRFESTPRTLIQDS